jgi:hypothetical protein
MALSTTVPIPTDDAKLLSILGEMVGLPFLFARPSYGEELTLHFGESHAMSHPKLCHLNEGSHIVRTRLSGWEWLRQGEPPIGMGPREEISSDDMHKRCDLLNQLLPKGTSVLSAHPRERSEGGAVQRDLVVIFSDWSRLLVNPDGEQQIVESDEEEIADWEIITTDGCLLVGPGRQLYRSVQNSISTITITSP